MKICKKCKLSAATSGSYCSLCRKEYDNRYFKNHREAKTLSATTVKRELLKWYRACKTGKACIDCGGIFQYFQVEYDHVPGRGKKFLEVSRMVRSGYTKEKILQEMAKCDILCKNCHALRTHNRLLGKKGSPNTYE